VNKRRPTWTHKAFTSHQATGTSFIGDSGGVSGSDHVSTAGIRIASLGRVTVGTECRVAAHAAH